MKNQYLKERLEEGKSLISGKTLRAVDRATQKGASSWLTVLLIRDMDFDLNKSEFQDAVIVPDTPFVFSVTSRHDLQTEWICHPTP